MRKIYGLLLALGIVLGAGTALPNQLPASGTTSEFTVTAAPKKYSGEIPGSPHRRGGVQYADGIIL